MNHKPQIAQFHAEKVAEAQETCRVFLRSIDWMIPRSVQGATLKRAVEETMGELVAYVARANGVEYDSSNPLAWSSRRRS